MACAETSASTVAHINGGNWWAAPRIEIKWCECPDVYLRVFESLSLSSPPDEAYNLSLRIYLSRQYLFPLSSKPLVPPSVSILPCGGDQLPHPPPPPPPPPTTSETREFDTLFISCVVDHGDVLYLPLYASVYLHFTNILVNAVMSKDIYLAIFLPMYIHTSPASL